MRWLRFQRMRWPICLPVEGTPGASRGARRKLGGAAKREREREQILRVARESPKVLHQIVPQARPVVLWPPERSGWFQVEDGVVKAHTASETLR
jgi:hypothetical protein